MKLRAKLLLAVVPVVATAMLTLGVVTYVQLRAGTEEELVRQMDLLLVQTAERVQSLVDTMEANARLFASSSLIERYVREEDEGERYELMQPALLALFSSYRDAYPDYREIRLLLPDGYEDTRLADPALANATEEEGGTPWFRAALAGGGRYRSVVRSADDGVAVRLVAHPIVLADRDVDPTLAVPRLRGVLAVTAGLDALGGWVERQRIGRTGYLQVLDEEGTVLFGPDAGRIGASLPGIAAAFDATGTSGRHSLHGTAGLVHGRRLADGLLLIAVMPDGEFALARRRLAATVALLTFAAAAAVAALVFLRLDRLVLGPLGRLGHHAREIGDGRLDASAAFDAAMRRRGDEIGDLAGAFGEMRDKLRTTLGELRGSHARIAELAFRDSLTGLPNRRAFLDLAERTLERANERGGRVALLFLDLDDFKRVNDTLGHDAGDELLREAARRLRALLSEASSPLGTAGEEEAHVCRLGGDEFTVLLPLLDRRGAADFAARAVASLSDPILIGGREVVVGTSVGVALYPDDGGSCEALIKCGDTAMYEAKRREGSLWLRFDRDMQATLQRALRLESDLRGALADPAGSGLSLHYQPQLDIAGGGFVCVEALARWHHPTLGRIAPDEFVPLAERTGMIRELGRFVLEEAASQWSRWSAVGLGTLRVAVNVSPRQFALGDVRADVERALGEHDMPADRLELELTESGIMEAPEAAVATLQELRLLGVRVAMDDFGTGHSSLAVLLELPIDTLKIDRSFVTGLAAGTPRGQLVHAILALAQGFGLEVVAEGVETEGELAFLRAARCDLAQGYLLAAPVPEAEATRMLLASREACGAGRTRLAG